MKAISWSGYLVRIMRRGSVYWEETVKLKEWIEQVCLTEQKEKEHVRGAWAAEGLTRELVDRYIDRVDVDREGRIEPVWKETEKA